MSTFLNSAIDESTFEDGRGNIGDSIYRYGKDGTEPSVLSEENLKREPRSIVRLSLQRTKESKTEIIKQKWSGTVLDHDETKLTTKLEDLTNRTNPDEIVVLSMEEISDSDRLLVQNGAMFFWQIGYRQGTKYPRERFSKINFRRLPEWTEDEVERAEVLAKDYADFFLTDPA